MVIELLLLDSMQSEPLMRIELMTSSLPRKCSTPELQRHNVTSHPMSETSCFSLRKSLGASSVSGRRDSNPPPTAWKAVALPDELLPQGILQFVSLSYISEIVGRGGFEPPKASPTDLQSAPFDRSGISPDLWRADGRIRTADRLITNQLLWPTELHRHHV